ncbi:hypothetical protein ANTQUA_LOCUS8636 [Anthophora quadrimaculata]
MFKQLLRSNQAYKRAIRGTVNVNSRRCKSTEDLRKAFAEAFSYILNRTKMDIDQKMKELAEMFSKTSKELGDLVKKNEQFIVDEMQRIEESVRAASEECSKGKMDRLRDVKEAYEARIKICNEKAAEGLRAAKTKCDQRIEALETLTNSMKQILKECLETDEFIECIGSRTKEATNQRKQVSSELNDTVQIIEVSVKEKLEDAIKCHANAQKEALESLHQILKETKECIE